MLLPKSHYNEISLVFFHIGLGGGFLEVSDGKSLVLFFGVHCLEFTRIALLLARLGRGSKRTSRVEIRWPAGN